MTISTTKNSTHEVAVADDDEYYYNYIDDAAPHQTHIVMEHIGALCPYIMTLVRAVVMTTTPTTTSHSNNNDGSCWVTSSSSSPSSSTGLLYLEQPPSTTLHLTSPLLQLQNDHQQSSINIETVFIIMMALLVIYGLTNLVVGLVAICTPVEHPIKKWALHLYYYYYYDNNLCMMCCKNNNNNINNNNWLLLNKAVMKNKSRKAILYTTILLMAAFLFHHQDLRTATNIVFALSTIIISVILHKKLDEPLEEHDGPELFFEHLKQMERRRMVEQFQPLPEWFYRLLNIPVKLLTGTPEWYGLDNITGGETSSTTTTSTSTTSPTASRSPSFVVEERHPKQRRPALYVMNHSRYGIEMSCTVGDLYEKTGVHLRGLGDNFHFLTPVGSVLKVMGAVQGTKENINALMEGGENILVYPGGAHEIMKPSTCPNYSLKFWKERLGFVRYAIKNKYDIIPIACVGAEELVDVVYDVDASMVRNELTIPIPSLLPKIQNIQKMYFWVGQRISTDHFDGIDDYLDDDLCRTIRDKTRTELLSGIEFLQQRQAEDPNRFLTQRISTFLSSIFRHKETLRSDKKVATSDESNSFEKHEDSPQRNSNKSAKTESSSCSSVSTSPVSVDEDSDDSDDEST